MNEYTEYKRQLLYDKLNRANCFNRTCDSCNLLCKTECLQTADTHTIRYYITDLERKYNDVKSQVLEINSKLSEGDFSKGIAELINLCKQLEQE